MLEDLRFVIRRLVKSTGFTFLVVLTLAVAIGANTAIFSVVKAVLLNPLPFEEPERLVGVWHTAPGLGFPEMNASPSTYYTYREEGRVFEDSGIWRPSASTVTGEGEPERLRTLMVTESVLKLLRVKAASGRIFNAEDDSPAGQETVILTHAYWQRRFGGDPSILGRSLTVDGKPRLMIGILPQNFRYLNENPELILPLRLNRAEVVFGQFSYMGVARLKPGVTLQQANADVGRMLEIMQSKFPLPPGLSLEMVRSARLGPNVRPFLQDAVGNVGDVLWILMGTAGLVLLIACANVANLLLVRGEGRQQELAVRVALGADRFRIARQLLLESVTLGLAGGLLGVPLAHAAIRLLISLRPTHIPRLDEITIDPTVLAYAAALSLLTGLVFGLIPVLKFAAPQVANALRDGGRNSSAGRERHRARGLLVVTQVAMALVLMIGSGLMLRTFQSLRKVEPGFVRPAEVLTMRIAIPPGQVPNGEPVVRMQERLIRQMEQIPGVTSVAATSTIPMDGNTNNDPIFVEEFPEKSGKLPPLRRFKFVSQGYFTTMGNPLLVGRELTWEDAYQGRNHVVVSESFARQYWKQPSEALGKRIRESPNSPWHQIVGVAGNERDDGANKPAPSTVFWPLLIPKFWDETNSVQSSLSFVIRTPRTGTQGFLKDVQSAVWAVNPGLPTANVRTLAEIQSRSMMRTSFTLLMLAVAGAIAFLLGIVGIYGVVSYAVSQRTREIGVRMALGAQRMDVSRLFLLDGLRLIAIGLAIGTVSAFGASRLLTSVLFGVKPLDPLTYALVSLGLASAALLACYLPARRAAILDPMLALRSE